MKLIYLTWLLLSHFRDQSKSSILVNKKLPTDTAKLLKTFDVAGNPSLKGLANLQTCDIYKDSFYLVNQNKIIAVSLYDFSTTINPALGLFLTKKIKENKYP